ncbi:MAG: hypothetical protein JXJ19_09095 [Elusimicrobia bacterium]|nr:hypothetical protein [Elusimicrobiota bacterium]
MRWVLILLLAVLPVGRVTGQDGGDLDLPDVFIWGEDLSILPGLDRDRLFMSPNLRKSNFMGPLQLGYSDKLNPYGDRYGIFSGLDVTAGWGTFDDYILRASQERLIKNNWYYNYALSASRDHIEDEDEDYSGVAGAASVGKQYDKARFSGGAKGISSEAFSRRKIYNVNADVLLDVLGVTADPGFFHTSGEIGSGDTSQTEASLRLSRPVFSNQWMMLEGVYGEYGLYGGSEDWTEGGISYVNSVFRDFSFKVSLGRSSLSGGRFLYAVKAAGDYQDTGYSVFLEEKDQAHDIFSLYSMYPFLELGSAFRPEERLVTGLGLARTLVQNIRADIVVRYSSIDDYMTIIDSEEGHFALSLEEKTGLLEAFAVLSLKKAYMEYSYSDADKKLPYIYNKVSAGYVLDLLASGAHPVEIDVSLEYITDHDLWKNPEGTEREKVDAFADGTLGIKVKITDVINFMMEGRNLFSRDIMPRAGYPWHEPRYMAMLNFGFNSRR